MKKIIILLITCLLLTGCYNNIELNELSIVIGLGLDYEDNEYKLTYEILNDNQKSENTVNKSYTITGKGKNLSDAIVNTNYKLDKKAYFSHLKVLIVSENIIKGKFDEIMDYFLRDKDMREAFFIVVSSYATPEEILQNNSDSIPVVSNYIENLLKTEKYNNNLAIPETFLTVLSNLISKNNDIILNSVGIKKDDVYLDESYIFNKDKYVDILSKDDTILYNLLTKDLNGVVFSKDYDNKAFVIKINTSKTKIDVTDNKITITPTLEASILENNPDFNLKESETYTKISKDFSKIIEEDITKLILILQKNKSDILGFQEIYYKKYNKDNDNKWLYAKLDINVSLKISRKGLIFEVKDEK